MEGRLPEKHQVIVIGRMKTFHTVSVEFNIFLPKMAINTAKQCRRQIFVSMNDFKTSLLNCVVTMSVCLTGMLFV